MSSETEVALPFNGDKLRAVLGHSLLNDKFYAQVAPQAKPTWFPTSYHQTIFRVKSEFVARYKRSPTIAEIQNDPSIMVLPPEDRRRVGEEISAAVAATQTFGLDALSAEMTKWMKAVIIWQSTDQIKRAYTRRDIDEAGRFAEEMVEKIKKARVDTRPSVNWRDWRNMLTQRQADYDNALTFGCTLFDRLLLSAGKGGSLVRGDTTLLLAATGGGKTSVSFTIAAANMVRQHSVLIITHEQTEPELWQKMLCILMRLSAEELMNAWQNPEVAEKLDMWSEWLSRYVEFVHMPEVGVTVEEVVATVRRKNEERRVATGKGFSLVIDDYPGCLTTNAAGKVWAKREIQDYVYDQMVQLAVESVKDGTDGFHMLVTIQGTREASKIASGENRNTRILTKNDVAESFGPAKRATNVITINRPPEGVDAGWVSFHIDKSRSSSTNWVVTCRSAYQWGLTHAEDLGATCYRSQSTMADRIEGLLDKYRNQAIPQHEVQR